MPQYSGKRILKKYIGTQQVYDDSEGQWQNIGWTSSTVSPANGTIQFLAVKGRIIFKGDLLVTTKQTSWTIQINPLPAKYKNLQVISQKQFTSGDWFDLTNSSILLSGHGNYYSDDQAWNLAQIQLSYSN